MKQFATIIFVLLFVLAGKSQSQDFSFRQIGCNSTSIANGSSTSHYPILIQDFYYDIQDTEDLDGCDSVFVLPDSQINFQHKEIGIFAAILPSQQIIQVGELLLDLPPPSLSV